MLRDKNLIPLSHQHQHALALCVRIDRASPVPATDLPAWQAEIVQLCKSEIEIHFSAEERIIFPVAKRFAELAPLVETLLADHAELRKSFAQAGEGRMSAANLRAFAQRLSAHVRSEERQLFEQMQQLLTPEELTLMGEQLEDSLKDAAQTCVIPSEATRLRATK
jgi:hypothetical protein